MYKEQVFMEGTTSPRAPGSAFSQMCPLKALHMCRVPLQIKTLRLEGRSQGPKPPPPLLQE